jgi:hypothetical protein
MTVPEERSARPSGRVADPGPMAAVQRAADGVSAPESIAPGPVSWAGVPGPGPERQAARTGRKRRRLLTSQISARDWAVLEAVGRYRYLTTNQLQQLFFFDHRTATAAARLCRRALLRLHDDRLLERLERRIGGLHAGSAASVWRLGPVGDRLLRERDGLGGHARRKEPSLHHLDHCLAVADSAVQLTVAARAGAIELLAVAPEPTSWRRYLGASGVPVILKPDLYAVTASGDYEDAWFIEIDRGTESLPTVLRQCQQYERYRRTGREQADGGVFPWVLWVVPGEARAAKLRRAIAENRYLDQQLFRVTTTAGFLATVTGGAA